MTLAGPGILRMRPLIPSAPPALWVLGCLTLLLWLWVLCTACHRKREQRQRAQPQGNVRPVEVSLLRGPHICILSKSDTRLHELHQSQLRCTAPRPASMNLLLPQCLEVSRDTTRSPAAFSHPELPRTSPATTVTQPSMGPEATYSNVGLAAIPRASLAASPVVWAGAQLSSSSTRPGLEAKRVMPEYACIRKLKGTDPGPHGLEQGKAQETPATQADIMYSRVSKPKRRDPGPTIDQLDPKGKAAVLTLGRNLVYEALPLRGLSRDNGLLENVYETIQETGALECQQTPSSS